MILLNEHYEPVLKTSSREAVVEYLGMTISQLFHGKAKKDRFFNENDGKYYSLICDENVKIPASELLRTVKYLNQERYQYKTITDLNEKYLLEKLEKLEIKVNITHYGDCRCYLVERVFE